MELWDAYDAQFRKIEGVTLVRGEPVPAGLFHLATDILVRHTDGSYLLIQDGREELRGEAYEIKDGSIRQISSDGEVVLL